MRSNINPSPRLHGSRNDQAFQGVTVEVGTNDNWFVVTAGSNSQRDIDKPIHFLSNERVCVAHRNAVLIVDETMFVAGADGHHSASPPFRFEELRNFDQGVGVIDVVRVW